MDDLGTRGKWKKKCPINILALLCMLSLASGTPTSKPEKNCPDHLFESNGSCCNKCPPGFKLLKVCEGAGQTTCVPCEKGKTFTAYTNFRENCESCRKCKGNHYEEVESNCTTTRNTVCRCKEGFYKENIDSYTFGCHKCTKCGKGQKPKTNCTREQDTVCECLDSHYKDKNKCLLCERCTESCKHLCPLPSGRCDPNSLGCEGTSFSTALPIGVCATTVLLVVVGFITYKVTKDRTTKKLISSLSDTSVPTDSTDCTKVLMHNFKEHPDNECDKVSPPSSLDLSNLPDCIPKSVAPPAVSELIYAVLHEVPVPRVKELARKLGVPDIEIERAEADYRQSKEAHYHMLKVWADRGLGLRAGGGVALGGGRGDVQQQPWLQELLDKLEDMNLCLAAQELEKKYSCQ